MKKLADITTLSSWPKLQKLGFKKIKYRFQGLAYCYGAESENRGIEIEPQNRTSGLVWNITHRSYSPESGYRIRSKEVKGQALMKEVEYILENGDIMPNATKKRK